MNGKHQRCDSYLTSTSYISLLYAFVMTYLVPLFFKFYIISANSFQIERFIPVSQLHLIENYPSANGLSFLIFLALSEFTIAKNKKVVTKFFFLTTFTPLSLSACLSLFTFCCGINFSLINCFLYTSSIHLFYTLIILRYASLLLYSISTVERIPFFSIFSTKLRPYSCSL